MEEKKRKNEIWFDDRDPDKQFRDAIKRAEENEKNNVDMSDVPEFLLKGIRKIENEIKEIKEKKERNDLNKKQNR